MYDVEFDKILIEQSIATQYGVLPDAQKELSYPVWVKLVSGLMDDTPLGRVVSIRAEKDNKIIAKMTTWQRKVRADWNAFRARKQEEDPENLELRMSHLEKMLASAFGGEKGG